MTSKRNTMPRKFNGERHYEEKIRWGRWFTVVIKMFKVGFIEQRPARVWKAPLGICGRNSPLQEPDVRAAHVNMLGAARRPVWLQ